MQEIRYQIIDPWQRKELLSAWTRDKGITAAFLKRLASFFMLLDHISQGNMLYQAMGIGAGGIFHFWTEPRGLAIGSFMVLLGRIAFPIYCFFLVQGVFLTQNYRKYIFRLFAFGIVSEIPFDLGLFGRIDWSHQNVFFTLALGASLLVALEKWEEKKRNGPGLALGRLALILGFGLLAHIGKTDYGIFGISAILCFYLGYKSRVKTLLLGVLGFFFESSLYGFVYLSLPLLYFYNGKRGKMNKYFYYFFYPVHLGLIYLLRDYLIPIMIG